MDKKQVISITQEFVSRVIDEIALQRVVLYGSWVDGHPDENSDIDIVVVMKSYEWDHLDLLTKLYQIATEIDVRIEPVLFEENKDPSGFLKKIMRQGEILYEQESTTA